MPNCATQSRTIPTRNLRTLIIGGFIKILSKFRSSITQFLTHLFCLTPETADDVRKFEIRDGKFPLNGEPCDLMGVEPMAGSNPEFGMAEPTEWITHDHADTKHLNRAFTRVHWPQDKRVLDYCDRHGILIETEVPAWGPDNFNGVSAQPDADILENGLEQLREMIARDFNHPSVVVWGLCNEIGGQDPPAYQLARHMLAEAERLDPGRLCSRASNSLDTKPERDVAGLMDFIEANEYSEPGRQAPQQTPHTYSTRFTAYFPISLSSSRNTAIVLALPNRPKATKKEWRFYARMTLQFARKISSAARLFSVKTTTVLTWAIAVWVRCSSAPGSETKLELVFTQPEAPVHIQIDVLRPTSFSAYSLDWKP
jgi:hypothetical protein